MKNIAVVSVLFAVFMAEVAYSETITMVTGNFCPYVCDPAEENGRTGFTVEIFKTIFEKQGYNVKIEILPWNRAMDFFNKKHGGTSGIIGVTRDHPISRDLSVFPEIEICRYTHAFYVLKTSPLAKHWKYEGTGSLKGLKLGAAAGWSYCGEDMTKYVAEAPAAQVEALYGNDITRRNFLRLMKNRTDILITNISVSDYFIFREKEKENREIDNVMNIDNLPCDGEVNSYPAFYNNEKGRKYAKIFAEGMKEIRESGRLDEILANYGLRDWR